MWVPHDIRERMTTREVEIIVQRARERRRKARRKALQSQKLTKTMAVSEAGR